MKRRRATASGGHWKAAQPGVFEAASAEAARSLIEEHQPQLMLVDINMPEEDGISLVKSLAELPFRPLAIMITAYSTARVAVDAMKAGAYDYLTKPFEIDELRLVVNRALEKIDLRANRDLRKQIGADGQFGRLLGKSSRMQQLFATADQVAAADVTVLIYGESGTGKELLGARNARPQPAQESCVCRGKLRRVAGRPHRERAFWA